MTTDNRGHRLHAARNLTDRHFGRQVTHGDMTGELVGLIPCGDTVTLALIVGGARAWLPVDADAAVEVWQKGATS